jgi:predicted secreted Zn-dependent protease
MNEENAKTTKKKVEAGVGREFKEKTRFEIATASRESAKMKQSVQSIRMEEDPKCSTSREVLNLSMQAYNQRADAFHARSKVAQSTT